MGRRICAAVNLFLGVLIGLGAFGHGFQGVKLQSEWAADPLAARTKSVILVVWYFVSGSMLLFGGLIVWAWVVARR